MFPTCAVGKYTCVIVKIMSLPSRVPWSRKQRRTRGSVGGEGTGSEPQNSCSGHCAGQERQRVMSPRPRARGGAARAVSCVLTTCLHGGEKIDCSE